MIKNNETTKEDEEVKSTSFKQRIKRFIPISFLRYYRHRRHKRVMNKNRRIEAMKSSQESVWAHIFSDTIQGSQWLHNKSFSPGRMAMGYPPLYVLYRVLNELQPSCILELGLGQSTRMIGQYATANPDIEHLIVEHDKNWIDFFSNDFTLSPNSTIVTLPFVKTSYKKCKNINSYTGFSEAFDGKKFSLISIDAPFGSKGFSRIDILRMLPQCLAENFVILLDDYDRPGEKNTFEEMKKILDQQNISYATGIYSGQKDAVVLVSSSLKFVTTM